jgi:2'-5' RNA ligase
MQSDPDQFGRINLFSLVAYVPDPLGAFLDRVRQELVPSCRLRAHVTILPPRPISDGIENAAAQLRSQLAEAEIFRVHAAEVDMFSLTSVVYVAVGDGLSKLRRLHDFLNTGALKFCEPFPYYPHLTLAQQLTPEQVSGVYETARIRWAAFPFDRSFPIETLTFVQGTAAGTWIDLEECQIGQPAHVVGPA